MTDEVDGSASESTTSVDQIVVSGGTQIETVTQSAGTTVIGLVTTSTTSGGSSITRTSTSDLADGSTLNLTTVAQTVTSSGGSTTTQTDTSANGTVLDQTVTTDTPQSGGGLVITAINSELDNGAFVVIGTSTTMISNAGSATTTTVVNNSANGALLSGSITSSTLGSPARTVTTYANGDGKVSQYEAVTVSGMTTTDALENLNGDGSLNSGILTTTSGGSAKTIQINSTGSGTVAVAVFDHTTTDNTTSSGGISTETVTDYGASIANEIDQTQTVVSANGLTTTVYSDFTGAAFVADGSWDQITTDQTTVSSGSSLGETITVTDGASHTLQTTQKTTSADRRIVTTTTTLGTSGLVRQVEAVTAQGNGTVQDQVVNSDQLGDVINATVTTTTADGLSKTVQNDIQGQSAAAFAAYGPLFDRTTTDTTVINLDGSRQETTSLTSQNGALLSRTSVLTSPNGLSTTTTANPFGTTHYATKTTDATTLNVDGGATETATDFSYDQTLIDRTQTTTSASGLSSAVLHDLDGDGVIDQSSADIVTINADGSRTEVVTDYTGGTNGVVRDIVTTQSGIIVAGAGLKTVVTRQSNGSVPIYQTETIQTSADRTVTDTTQYRATAVGPLLSMTTVTTSANGLTKTTATDVNGDGTTDFSTANSITLNADGSRTETVTNYNQGILISETVQKTLPNGLSTTTQVDANGAVNGGTPIFNSVTTDSTVLNTTSGGRTETVTTSNANGATIEQIVTTTSADRQTIATNRYLDETGTITNRDQSETINTQANGSVVDTTTTYDAANVLMGTITKTTSGNGLTTQTVYQNSASATVDTQSETTTYDTNGDGDGGTLLDCEDTDIVNGTTTLTTR